MIVIVSCVLLSMSSNRLFRQWVCLEINMLCFIPILVRGLREQAILTGVKYFISQRLASMVFIIRILLTNRIIFVDAFIRLALIFKLGVPPFHSWLISVLTRIGYSRIFMLFTIQKFIPLFIISQIIFIELWLWVLILRLLGVILMTLNRIGSFYLLLILSGALNTIWMLRRVSKGGSWVGFLLTYRVVLGALIFGLAKTSVIKVNDVTGLDWRRASIIRFHLLNLGGLPPLVGFLVKLKLLKPLTIISLSLSVTLVIGALIVLYLYVVYCYQVFSLPKKKEINSYAWSLSSLLSVRGLRVAGSVVFLWLL